MMRGAGFGPASPPWEGDVLDQARRTSHIDAPAMQEFKLNSFVDKMLYLTFINGVATFINGVVIILFRIPTKHLVSLKDYEP